MGDELTAFEIGYCEEDYDDDFEDFTEEDVLKVGKSIIDDIDDRINREFLMGETPVEVGRFGRFRSIPDID